LYELGPEAKTAIPALIELLLDQDEEAQMAAACALGTMGPAAREAIPALTKLLRARPTDVRSSAAEALEKIKKQTPPGAVKKQ